MARSPIRSSKGRKQHAAAAKAATDQPVNTVAPAITGTKTVGQTLTLSNGTWTKSPTFARKWFQERVANSNTWDEIAGATGATYVLAAGQQGKRVKGRILAIANGITVEADSAPTTAIA